MKYRHCTTPKGVEDGRGDCISTNMPSRCDGRGGLGNNSQVTAGAWRNALLCSINSLLQATKDEGKYSH